MPASTNYIPSKQTDVRIWALNFSAGITANPGLYGLVAGDALTIANTVDAFDDALSLALDPATRSPAAIADKDAKRAQMLAIVRPYAIAIRNNAGVSDESKIALGITVVDRLPTPIPAPTTMPILGVLMATPQQLTCKYNDATTPTSKKKPFGAIGMIVCAEVSSAPITDPGLIGFKEIVSKSPFVIEFSSDDVGKKAYIACRWVTRRGLLGPWSTITQQIVA
jgi:hypothetical protein